GGAVDVEDNGAGTPVKPSSPTPGGTKASGATQPKRQDTAKAPAQTDTQHSGEAEVNATPAPKTNMGPLIGRAAIHIGTGAASPGIGLFISYLKAQVEQQIAQRQINDFLEVANRKINANPDEALKKMMVNPDATVYAWVNLDSAVIKTGQGDSE